MSPGKPDASSLSRLTQTPDRQSACNSTQRAHWLRPCAACCCKPRHTAAGYRAGSGYGVMGDDVGRGEFAGMPEQRENRVSTWRKNPVSRKNLLVRRAIERPHSPTAACRSGRHWWRCETAAGARPKIADRWRDLLASDRIRGSRRHRAVSQRHQWRPLRHGAVAMGRFYCPPDKQIFLDTGFFRQVETRFTACSGNACKFTRPTSSPMKQGTISRPAGILPRVTRLQAAGRQQGRSQCAEVRVECRRIGLSGVWVNRRREEASGLPRGRRHRRGVADRQVRLATTRCHVRRRDGWCRISFTHGSRGTAQAMFMNRLSAGHGEGLRYLQRGIV